MGNIICVLVVLIVLVLLESWRENRVFRKTYYRIESSKLQKLQRARKVIFLSDLHNHCYGEENQKLLDAIKKEEPDLILITGDMLIGKEGISPETAQAFVCQLPKICEVHYSNGNHEQRMKENTEKYEDIYLQYQKELKKAGVHFLENEHIRLTWDGVPVDLYGLEIPHKFYTKFAKMELSVEEIQKCIGASEKEHYKIVMAHNPVFADAYMKWGADLTLSGHLHGGLVRIPGLGGVISPQIKLFLKYSGELTSEGEQAVVVSKGLGMHTICFRFCNPAEMIVLQIGGKTS